MKIGRLTFNYVSSDTYGIVVAGAGSFDPAEPDMTSYSVPGKNGDILLDNHRYKNIDVTYPAFIPNDFVNQSQNIRNWILGNKSYKELSDSFDSAHYRLAVGKSVRFSPVFENTAANMSITFNCKPQRFLTSGKTQRSISSGDTLTNPSGFDAFPSLRLANVAAGASITFTNSAGTYTLTATAASATPVTIDCELMTIRTGTLNNELFSGDFPILHRGVTTITFSGMGVQIAPRWWEL